MPDRRPILDTHMHVYEVTRPGGVAWPRPESAIHRDLSPADYEAAARPLGVVGAVLVEASPLHEDNRWVLDRIAGSPFFPAMVAELAVDHEDFEAHLAALSEEPRVVGVRAFLWNPALTLAAVQLRRVALIAERGLTLDLISRGTLNPKDKVVALARAVPHQRIIVDHLAGAKGQSPTPAWVTDVRSLAACPNVSLKLSAFADMWNPDTDEVHPWESPAELSAYRPHFDVCFEAFGAERLIWGSNWPVCELSGSLERAIALAEEYLEPLGTSVRDRVMHDNARAFYRRAV